MNNFEINDCYYCSECGKYFFAPHYCTGKSHNTEPYKYQNFKLVESEDIVTKAMKDYLKTYVETSDKKTLEKLISVIGRKDEE